jgi:hypothetical protein
MASHRSNGSMLWKKFDQLGHDRQSLHPSADNHYRYPPPHSTPRPVAIHGAAFSLCHHVGLATPVQSDACPLAHEARLRLAKLRLQYSIPAVWIDLLFPGATGG